MVEALYFNCGFVAQGEPTCLADAIWHGIRVDRSAAVVGSMQCCREHLLPMRGNADYVHRMSEHCNLPGSQFCLPDNCCVYSWDELEEAA